VARDEQLIAVVKRFLQNAQEVDLNKWGNAVEATSHRVGFVLCGDLEVSAKMVSMEPVVVGGPQAKDKIKRSSSSTPSARSTSR
jgi:hypothetical protein